MRAQFELASLGELKKIDDLIETRQLSAWQLNAVGGWMTSGFSDTPEGLIAWLEFKPEREGLMRPRNQLDPYDPLSPLAREERKRTMLPPTPKMLERLNEYIDHPAMTPYLDRLAMDIPKGIRTRGGTGVLLNWMKQRIREWEG